jgi:DNA processing protein
MKKSEIFALTLIPHIGTKTIRKLVDLMIEREISFIQDINIDHFITGIKNGRTKNALKENLVGKNFQLFLEKAHQEIERIERKGVHIVSIYEKVYPQCLRLTQSAPIFLYCKGNLDLLKNTKNVAVVGTRKNTTQGKLITEKTVEFLVSNEYTIVSGLALGIDTIAHERTMKENGKAIAVLADVDNIQPAKNRELAEKILDRNGLLVAEEKPGVEILPSMFVKRDRIQSGLSLAVFPIETGKKGGTLFAVHSAKDEDRLIYAPDFSKGGYKNTDIEQLEGIKYLIDNHIAIPYTSAQYPHILQALKEKELQLCSNQKKQKDLFSIP